MTLTAAIYCRLSIAPDGSTENVERQEADAREVAGRLGWSVGEVYADNSKSAWRRDVRRKAWEQMLADLEAGRWGGVVVYHGDRLIRAPRDLEDLIDLSQKKGIRLASPTGERDLENGDDQFILRIEAAAQHREVYATSRRVTAMFERMAEQGLSRRGGRGGRTFGYGPDGLTVNDGEADAIRDAARRVLAGEPISVVARDLNASGFTTTAGGRWDFANLKKLLLRPRIAGLLARHGQIVGPAAWPAIVDRETWEAVRAVLEHRATSFPNANNARRYLLSGIALCGPCRSTVVVRQAGGSETQRGYSCINRACKHKVHRAVYYVDPYVGGAVVERLSDPRIQERATAPDARPLIDELARLERRREQKLVEFADDDDPLARDVLRVTIPRIDQQITRVRGQLAASQSSHVLDGLWGIDLAGWEALPLTRQRAAVQALVRVTILPKGHRRPGFDPTTVLVEDILRG